MKKGLLYVVFFSLCLTGCQSVEIQHRAYAVGIGIDYQDDEYIVYLQFLDFSNLAKTETSTINEEKPVWIAEGHGQTIDQAFVDIYNGLQIQANYDQMHLFVFSKDALEEKLEDILESLSTNFNFRLNGYVYATDGSIIDLLSAKMPFYYPFTSSHLSQPDDLKSLASDIPPLTMEELMIKTAEKTKQVIVPDADLNDTIVFKDEEGFTVPFLKGAHFVKNNHYLGFLNREDLYGYINLNNYGERSMVEIQINEGELPSSVELKKPKVKVGLNDDQSSYHLKIKTAVIFREGVKKVDPYSVEEKLIEQVRKTVMASIDAAAKKEIDLYSFEDYLYRHHPKLWKAGKHKEMINRFSAEDIDIRITYVKSYAKIYTK